MSFIQNLSREYNFKDLVRCLCLIVLTAAALKVTKGIAAVVFLPICLTLLARKKMDWLFFWVFMMIMATLGNPNFFPKSQVFFMSTRVTLVAITCLAASWMIGRRHSPIVAPFKWLMPYLFWEACISLGGWQPIVSYLKLFLFTAIYFAYYAVADSVIQNGRSNTKLIRAIVVAFAVFILVGSVCLLPFPGLSQLTAKTAEEAVKMLELKSLFMGMMNHSQSFGPMTAALAVLILGDMLFAIKKFDKIYVLLMLIAPLLLWRTSSRTAMGTFIAGAAIEIFLFMRTKGLSVKWKGKILGYVWLALTIAAVAVCIVPSARESAIRFATKVSKDTDIKHVDVTMDAFTSSREGMVQHAMYNFKKKPITGNGFQVSDVMANVRVSSWMQYLSAPIEKGVWVAAVLEEGGIVGFVLFAGFLIAAFAQCCRNKAYITASMVVCGAVLNMGEFAYFSMSYTGGFMWALTFTAVVMDAQRLRWVGPKHAFETIEMRMAAEAHMRAANGIDLWKGKTDR